jgi:hypothetical protein
VDHRLLAARTEWPSSTGRIERIPDPGLIVVGKIEAGMEAFAVPGAIKATIERS